MDMIFYHLRMSPKAILFPIELLAFRRDFKTKILRSYLPICHHKSNYFGFSDNWKVFTWLVYLMNVLLLWQIISTSFHRLDKPIIADLRRCAFYCVRITIVEGAWATVSREVCTSLYDIKRRNPPLFAQCAWQCRRRLTRRAACFLLRTQHIAFVRGEKVRSYTFFL